MHRNRCNTMMDMQRILKMICLTVAGIVAFGLPACAQTAPLAETLAAPDSLKPWALVSVSVESLRSEPRHASELSTQALLGTPLKILGRSGEFYRVEMPDRYVAYVPDKSVVRCSNSQLQRWKESRRLIVTEMQTKLTDGKGPKGGMPVCDVVAGCILEVKREHRHCFEVTLPDGREGRISKEEVEPLEEWAHQEFDVDLLEQTAREMMGMPYLWGGMSAKAADCSGFVRLVYFANGILLPRDASQQARTGRTLDVERWRENARKGDLIFIGKRPGRVSHVGIYLDHGHYIHCSGRVKVNSLVAGDDDCIDDYLYLSLVRIEGEVGTEGIVWVRDHPWYF